MIYAYVRVSTTHQNVDNGRFEIEKFAQKNGILIGKWVFEKVSSTTELSRRQLGELLKKLKKGDILLSTEISRLGRNLMEIMDILHYCLKRDCQVWTIKESYRLGFDIQSKVLAFAFALSAEIERSLISARTTEALQRVKAAGKKLGRPKGIGNSNLKLSSRHDEFIELIRQGTGKRKIAALMKVSPTTVYSYLSKINSTL